MELTNIRGDIQLRKETRCASTRVAFPVRRKAAADQINGNHSDCSKPGPVEMLN